MNKSWEGSWAKMPVSWQKDPEFQQKIRAAPQGDAIAALKLYIALCLKANFSPTEALPQAGSVKASLTTLCELVDISRPTVIAGLKLLAEWGIVVSGGGRPATLYIVEYSTARNWVKLPKRPLYGSKRENRLNALMHMSNRRRATLHALQLYLYLAVIRDKDSYMARLGYDLGQKTLGMSRNQFSSALSMLSIELLTVRTSVDVKNLTGAKYSTNQYWLRGSRNDPYRVDPAEADLDALAGLGEEENENENEDENDEDVEAARSKVWESFIQSQAPQRKLPYQQPSKIPPRFFEDDD